MNSLRYCTKAERIISTVFSNFLECSLFYDRWNCTALVSVPLDKLWQKRNFSFGKIQCSLISDFFRGKSLLDFFVEKRSILLDIVNVFLFRKQILALKKQNLTFSLEETKRDTGNFKEVWPTIDDKSKLRIKKLKILQQNSSRNSQTLFIALTSNSRNSSKQSQRSFLRKKKPLSVQYDR